MGKLTGLAQAPDVLRERMGRSVTKSATPEAHKGAAAPCVQVTAGALLVYWQAAAFAATRLMAGALPNAAGAVY